MTLRFSHVAFTPGVSHDQPRKITPRTKTAIAARRQRGASLPSASSPNVRDWVANARAADARMSKSKNRSVIQQASVAIDDTAKIVMLANHGSSVAF
jgi:hypothetical protein